MELRIANLVNRRRQLALRQWSVVRCPLRDWLIRELGNWEIGKLLDWSNGQIVKSVESVEIVEVVEIVDWLDGVSGEFVVNRQ